MTAQAKTFTEPNYMYIADNGEVVCHSCAGSAVKHTGCDISGQRVRRVNTADNQRWVEFMGQDMACGCGSTSFADTRRAIQQEMQDFYNN